MAKWTNEWSWMGTRKASRRARVVLAIRRLVPGIYSNPVTPLPGHRIYDPSSTCGIHSRTPEPFCDLKDEDTARYELAEHARTDAPPDELRTAAERITEGRRT